MNENLLEATIIVAGKRLKLVGTHSTYMQALRAWRGLRAWRADQSAVAAAVKDIPRGSLCLDIGAHIGLTAIVIAVFRPDCRVVAFEPQPLAQKRPRENLAANAITNVEVIEAAVADFSGSLSFNDNGPCRSQTAAQSPVSPSDWTTLTSARPPSSR